MSPLFDTLSITLAVVVCVMVTLWLVSLIRRDASIVDPFWGSGFVIVVGAAWILNLQADVSTNRSILLLCLVTIWGLRLSLFLLWRNLGHGEDRRYQAMR